MYKLPPITGGPKVGGGHPFSDRPDWVRRHPIRPLFRDGEAADLSQLAEDWGVPRSTIVWAVVSDWLARARRLRASYPSDVRGALGKAAAIELLRIDPE